MALDRELFEAFVQDPNSAPTLRIYQVSEPGVSVGRSYKKGQSLWEPVCVRPTGGGRVRHGNDFLYSVTARRDSFPAFHQVRTSYLSFHEVVQEALASLGVETTLVRCDNSQARKNVKRRSLEDCFHRPVPTDLVLEGRKIAGAAQWRRAGAFLHQGSVQLVRGVSSEDLKQAFLEAFERKFDVVWSKMVGVGRG